MYDNGTYRETPLDAILEQLEAQIAEQEQLVADLREQIAPHEDQLRKMRKMLNAAVGPQPGQKHKVTVKAARMGEEELRIVLTRLNQLPESDWIDPLIPGSFTERSLSEGLGVSKDTANRMVKYLREQELIRLVGERKMPGAPRPSRVYAVVTDNE